MNLCSNTRTQPKHFNSNKSNWPFFRYFFSLEKRSQKGKRTRKNTQKILYYDFLNVNRISCILEISVRIFKSQIGQRGFRGQIV